MKEDAVERKLELKIKEKKAQGGMESKGVDVQMAVVNLMKICIKRRDGQVMAEKGDTRVTSIWSTCFLKYLMIDGKGR